MNQDGKTSGARAIPPLPGEVKLPGRFLLPAIFTLGTLAASAAAFLLYRYSPLEYEWLPCPFYQITGLFCPGCGTQRALGHLVQGRILEACRQNLLLFTLTPLVVALLTARWLAPIQAIQKSPFGRIFAGMAALSCRPAFMRSVFWILVAFWIARNLPFWPLTLLAPQG